MSILKISKNKPLFTAFFTLAAYISLFVIPAMFGSVEVEKQAGR